MMMLIHVGNQPTKVVLAEEQVEWLVAQGMVAREDFIQREKVFIMREVIESDFHSGYLVLKCLGRALRRKGIYLFSGRKDSPDLREGQENRIYNWDAIFETFELLGKGKDEEFRSKLMARRGEYITAVLQDIQKFDEIIL